MPLFLPSDPDKFPTGELKKAVKPSPPKPDPKDTWVEVKPGIWENGLGQKKTEDKSSAKYAVPYVTFQYVNGLTVICEQAQFTRKFWAAYLAKQPEIVFWTFHY